MRYWSHLLALQASFTASLSLWLKNLYRCTACIRCYQTICTCARLKLEKELDSHILSPSTLSKELGISWRNTVWMTLYTHSALSIQVRLLFITTQRPWWTSSYRGINRTERWENEYGGGRGLLPWSLILLNWLDTFLWSPKSGLDSQPVVRRRKHLTLGPNIWKFPSSNAFI